MISGVSNGMFAPTNEYNSINGARNKHSQRNHGSIVGAKDEATFNSMFGVDGIDADEWSSGVGLSKYLFEALAGPDGKISWNDINTNNFNIVAASSGAFRRMLESYAVYMDNNYTSKADTAQAINEDYTEEASLFQDGLTDELSEEFTQGKNGEDLHGIFSEKADGFSQEFSNTASFDSQEELTFKQRMDFVFANYENFINNESLYNVSSSYINLLV